MNSGFLFWTPIILSIVLYFLYRKKYHLNAATWFGSIWLFMVLVLPIFQAEWHLPRSPFLILDTIFFGLIFIGGRLLYVRAHRLASIQNKTEKDVIKRQRIMRAATWYIVVLVASFPHILNHWGVHYLPNLEQTSWYQTQESIVIHYIQEGIKCSLLLPMGVILLDNILHKIASPIYTVNDIEKIEDFCLYLRSFSADTTEIEKRICHELKHLYPIFAIGDPNKILQPNGAKRIYATDTQWQDMVKRLSAKSKLIVLHLGQSVGTKWEINNILTESMLHKTVFLTSSQEDYNYLADIVNRLVGINLPNVDIQNNHLTAFFVPALYENDQYMPIIRLNSAEDVEALFNSFLHYTEQVNENYEKIVEYRKHTIKYIFNKDIIPANIRRSVNWGILSPVINMRHWNGVFWIMFLLLVFVSMIMNNTYVNVPILLFVIFAFFFGNRIEWLSGSYSSPAMFLQQQKHEAKLMYISLLIGICHTFLYLVL